MQALSRDLFLDENFVRVDVKEPQELLVWVKGISGRSVISRHVPAAACTGTTLEGHWILQNTFNQLGSRHCHLQA